eukprot:2683268-Amphidinium_carterae.1
MEEGSARSVVNVVMKRWPPTLRCWQHAARRQQRKECNVRNYASVEPSCHASKALLCCHDDNNLT